MPCHGHVLACHAFALGETGELARAEQLGRRAAAAAPDDLWAAHAVTHALGGLGRAREGIAWIAWLEPHLTTGGGFVRHIQWHRALFHLTLGQRKEALAVYERRIHDERLETTRDILDATSLLWRIEAAGSSASAHHRDELANIAERRIGDHSWAFADLHYVLCLAGAGRADAVAAMLASTRRQAGHGPRTQARILGEVGITAAEGVAASLGGDPQQAARLLAMVEARLPSLGGSRAQRELLGRVARKAERDARRGAARSASL